MVFKPCTHRKTRFFFSPGKIPVGCEAAVLSIPTEEGQEADCNSTTFVHGHQSHYTCRMSALNQHVPSIATTARHRTKNHSIKFGK